MQQGRQVARAGSAQLGASISAKSKTTYEHETRGSAIGVPTSHNTPGCRCCPASEHVMGCTSQASIALQYRTSLLAPAWGKHDRTRRAPAVAAIRSGWLLPALF